MSSYPYKRLDLTKNEIRVLRLLDSVNTCRPDVVHCALEHVSLDDLLPDFQKFLVTGKLSLDPDATRAWVHAHYPQSDGLEFGSLAHPLIAAWRCYEDRQDYAGNFSRALDLDASSVPDMPCFDPPSITGIDQAQNLQEVCMEIPGATEGCVMHVKPRFAWGDFEALSYYWDSDVLEKSVVVNSIIVQVPKNLEALLRKLQHLPEARSGMYFWIDGLCIDQGNNLEKNHQVHLMKRIYAQALSVVVWLGECDGDSDQAMDFIAQTAGVHLKLQARFDKKGELSHYGIKALHRWMQKVPWASILSIWSRNYWKKKVDHSGTCAQP